MPLHTPLLPVVDFVAPYLPSSLSDPLYTLATFDLANLIQNPLQFFPLLLSLLAFYWAWLSFISSARFAVRTSIALAKWGAVLSVLGAVYMGYNSAGTEKGVVGGLNDAVRIGSTVGKGVYSLGRKGAGYYFGAGKSSNSKYSKRSASGRARTWARPTNEGGWDDPHDSGRDVQAEEFVGDVLKKAQSAVFEFLSPPQEKVKRSAKKSQKASMPSIPNPMGGGLKGYAWDYAMGQAKKAWDDFSDENAGGKDAKGKKKSKYCQSDKSDRFSRTRPNSFFLTFVRFSIYHIHRIALLASDKPIVHDRLPPSPSLPLRRPLLGTPTLTLTSLYFSSLSSRYPPLPPVSASSPLLHPANPAETRLEDVAVFAARVPLRSILPPQADGSQPGVVDLVELTAELVHAFLRTPLIRLETALLSGYNPFSSSSPSSSPSPHQPPSSAQFPPVGRGDRLVGGALEVVHPPVCVEEDGRRLGRTTIKWSINPPDAVRFFERMAAWGYPCRLMDGGRHVFEVEVFPPWTDSPSSSSSDSTPTSSSAAAAILAARGGGDAEADSMLELRFGCAHDYTLFSPREGEKDDGGKIPAWSSWLHFMYARMLLDGAVERMKKRG
ncbi:hypothetical protein JCM11251_006321 [Rhodosporidiobolus azoricus]